MQVLEILLNLGCCTTFPVRHQHSLLRVIPGLPGIICVSRVLHWDRNNPFKRLQTLRLALATLLSHWNNDSAFPIAAIELRLLSGSIFEQLAPCALRAVGRADVGP